MSFGVGVEATTQSLLHFFLIGALWYLAAYIFLADTLGWYQIVLALWGGIPRVVKSSARQGCVALCCPDSFGNEVWTDQEANWLWKGIYDKLTVGPYEAEGQHRKDPRRIADATAYLTAFVNELHAEHLIDANQKHQLLRARSGGGAVGCADLSSTSNREAVRRLNFFAQSLQDSKLDPTRGAFRTPGLTTLVPSYNEAIVNQLPAFDQNPEEAESQLMAVCEARESLGFKFTSLFVLAGGIVTGFLVQVVLASYPLLVATDSTQMLFGAGQQGVAMFAGMLVGAFFVLFLATFGLLRFCVSWGRGATDRIEEELEKCGAVVTLTDGPKWQRGPSNLNNEELVQAAQLKLKQLLEGEQRATGGTQPALEEGSAARKELTAKWLKLAPYKVPADRAQRLSTNEMEFLMDEFAIEWRNLQAMTAEQAEQAQRAAGSVPVDGLDPVRVWASNRLQTVFRTLAGMKKGFHALAMQLERELPELTASERQKLARYKHRTLWALQTFGNGDFREQELDDVNSMMRSWAAASGIAIAYLENKDGKWHSCLVDADAMAAAGLAGPDKKPPPKFRIELPGKPILGDGKGDNQNCAIPYTRGHLLQAIDANQEGYIEEALKLSCALREFDGEDAPAILGFGEHIFSNLGALGDFAASSELAFGTLVQSTMASALQSRYHYGHPDIFDKFAMIGQGGISKATKKLNVSEDVFAGMDATLRGHKIKHVEYIQVGKGRDMGLLSILIFFSKLSMGTAMMTSSRQALRLGQRLGLARLFGFYYAHIGFYAGQLHYYHVGFGQLALALLGTLVARSGLSNNPESTEAASIMMFNNLHGPLWILFFLFAIVPLFFVTWERKGLLAAFRKPLVQTLQLAPLFYILQGRCIGHTFSRGFSIGEAAYQATGRGLAIEHVPFHKYYAFLCVSCYVPGVELAGFLLALLALQAKVTTLALIFASIVPLGLLYGPTLLNPHCFRLSDAWSDFEEWLKWLLRSHFCKSQGSAYRSWSEFHQQRCNDKQWRGPDGQVFGWGPRAKFFLMPSKELLLSVPLVGLAFQAIRRAGEAHTPPLASDSFPSMMILLVTIAPVMPFVVVFFLFAIVTIARAMSGAVGCFGVANLNQLQPATFASTDVRLCLFLASLFAGMIGTELTVIGVALPQLSSSDWVTLFFARYFAWRAMCNILAYASLWPIGQLAPTYASGLVWEDVGPKKPKGNELDVAEHERLRVCLTGATTSKQFSSTGDLKMRTGLQSPIKADCFIECPSTSGTPHYFKPKAPEPEAKVPPIFDLTLSLAQPAESPIGGWTYAWRQARKVLRMACALTQTSMGFLFDVVLGLLLQAPVLLIALALWPIECITANAIDRFLFWWIVTGGQHGTRSEQAVRHEVEQVRATHNNLAATAAQDAADHLKQVEAASATAAAAATAPPLAGLTVPPPAVAAEVESPGSAALNRARASRDAGRPSMPPPAGVGVGAEMQPVSPTHGVSAGGQRVSIGGDQDI